MSETAAEESVCKVCGTARSAHGALNHEFSLSGDLIKVQPKKDPAARAVVVVDSHLRKILVRKGILTAEDFLE